MVDDDSVAFPHSPQHVATVVETVAARVDAGERHYLRARDLDVDACNEVVGSVLALLINLCWNTVSSARFAHQNVRCSTAKPSRMRVRLAREMDGPSSGRRKESPGQGVQSVTILER